MMHVIVPIKNFALAKSRLASRFAADSRVLIAREMAVNLLEELARVDGVDVVTVASSEASMQPVARRLGFDFMRDRGSKPSLNAAVSNAVGNAVAAGATDVGIVLSDLPLFDRHEFEALMKLHLEGALRQLTMITDRAGRGTNVRLCRPGNLVPARYGVDSAPRHAAAARDAGAEVVAVRSTALSCDLDHPDDLEFLLAHRGTTVSVGARLRILLQKTMRDHRRNGAPQCA